MIIGAFVMKAYNQLITLDNKVEAEWSEVENVMQRRADLILILSVVFKAV